MRACTTVILLCGCRIWHHTHEDGTKIHGPVFVRAIAQLRSLKNHFENLQLSKIECMWIYLMALAPRSRPIIRLPRVWEESSLTHTERLEGTANWMNWAGIINRVRVSV